MDLITLEELREINGNFSLACLIAGNRLRVKEVKKMTDTELLAIKSRLTNERLLERVLNEFKKRKLFRV